MWGFPEILASNLAVLSSVDLHHSSKLSPLVCIFLHNITIIDLFPLRCGKIDVSIIF